MDIIEHVQANLEILTIAIAYAAIFAGSIGAAFLVLTILFRL